MKRGGGIHTVPARRGKGWWNERNGEVLGRFHTKELAMAAGREAARLLKEEHTIHNSDGVIAEKNSYGNDPCPPKDS